MEIKDFYNMTLFTPRVIKEGDFIRCHECKKWSSHYDWILEDKPYTGDEPIDNIICPKCFEKFNQSDVSLQGLFEVARPEEIEEQE